MSKNKNNFYYEQEIVSLIKSGVDPAEAKKIADAHLASGNYDKIIQQVANERKEAKGQTSRIHVNDERER